MPLMIRATDNNEIILMLMIDGQPCGAVSCADGEAIANAEQMSREGYTVYLTGISDGKRWTCELNEIM